MALIQCPECGKEVSDQAKVCIHCGFPLEREQPKDICIIDGLPFDFSEMLDIYRNRSRTQSVRSFNEMMDKIQTALGKDRDKQLRVYLLRHITDHGTVPPEICRKDIPRQDPREALTMGEKWMELDSGGPLRCPRCGSWETRQIQKSSVLWNFFGAGAPKNVCVKCGHKFRP